MRNIKLLRSSVIFQFSDDRYHFVQKFLNEIPISNNTMGVTITSAILWLGTVIFAYCIVFPVYTLIIVLNELIRFTIKLLLFCSRSEYELIGDKSDNVFLTQMDAPGGIMLAVLASPDGDINLAQERDLFLRKVLQKPGPNGDKMYKKLEKVFGSKWGYGCRRKVTISIDNHIKLWTETVPQNGNFYTDQEFVQDIIPRLAEPFKNYSTRPSWEFIIIPKVQLDGNDNNPSTVRIFRVHHSYMDGISLGLLITECLMNFHQGQGSVPFVLDPKAKFPKEVTNRILLTEIKSFFALPYNITRGLFNSFSVNDPLATGSPADMGFKRYGLSKNMKMDTVRDIQSKMRTCIGIEQIPVSTTNFLASIFVSALGQVLSERNGLSKDSSLSMRSAGAVFPYKDSRPRNRMRGSYFYFALNGENKIRFIDVTTTELSYTSRRLFISMTRFPLWVIRRLFMFAFQKFPSSTMFTSVPGTRVKGYLHCGGFVNLVGGWSVVAKQLALSVVVIGYGDDIRFWVTVDDTIMSRAELDRFLELLTTQVC